jgi:four helix bundle protein
MERTSIGKSFKNLIVWQRAGELTTLVYQATSNFPDSEKFGLTNQLRRAAVSIVSNISEGYARSTRGEFILLLGYARGSCAEVEAQLSLASKLGFASENNIEKIEAVCSEVGRMLNAMMKTLKERN